MMPRRTFRRSQRGVTILVVLVLLAVMLLGGLAMARMTEIGTLASGNTAFREASLQASEVGLNEAYAALQAVGLRRGQQRRQLVLGHAPGHWMRPASRPSTGAWRRNSPSAATACAMSSNACAR